MYLRKKWMTILVIMMAAFVLAACGSDEKEETKKDPPKEEPEEITLSLSEALEEYTVWIETEEEPTDESIIQGVYIFEDGNVEKYDTSGLTFDIEEMVDLSDEDLIDYVSENGEKDESFLEGFYTLDISLDHTGEETESIHLEVEEETQENVNFLPRNVQQTIFDTRFSGLTLEDVGGLFTRVGEGPVGLELDSSDSEHEKVTVYAASTRETEEFQEDIHNEPEEEIYAHACLACHGEDMSGGIGPSLVNIGDEYSEEELEDIIENGIGDMPGGMLDNEKAIGKLAKWLIDVELDEQNG